MALSTADEMVAWDFLLRVEKAIKKTVVQFVEVIIHYIEKILIVSLQTAVSM